MTSSQLQLKLQEFEQPRLPLGTPVEYAGLQCRITGRTFGKQAYDLEAFLGKHRYIWPNIPLESFKVSFKELADGTK